MSSTPTSDVGLFLEVLKTVEWTKETRLLGVLLTIYGVSLILTVISWRNVNLLCGHFVLICVAIYCAEWLNEWAAGNWRIFSIKHQYFDFRGLFISVVYSLPLLINLIVLLGRIMYVTGNQMIQVKRMQLKRKIHDEKAPDKKND